MNRIIFPILALALAIIACCSPCTPPLTESVSPTTLILNVYFTDINRYNVGTEPYETQVTRRVPATSSKMEETLTQLFQGPTEAEKSQGLAVIMSGTTGYNKLIIENGIAQVYLTGKCASLGSTYTIANLIFVNLKQFQEIRWVKIYDENGETETPTGQSDSIPFCLEP